ncbi:hypothetical protein J5N97_006877 [Dioscorea zingiberensis]|uniref:Uncharacterized protein n=1 Tax=Dioscorea zingiberensis TaxID=325984 RepID=A0A9D5DAT7_9LILI|nr:hypothetical protein J5N97_006877 [Dioscorea zingiberensis]
MARLNIMTTFLSLSRRISSIAADSTCSQGEVTAAMRAAAKNRGSGATKPEAFWMRDPITGYWIPENHFGVVDPVDLRAKLLPTKK